ncbi:MAG: hypothetical protein K6T83_09615 [Alicyclobacillus sp.]|nr:hypothetical protein [Alicyclobacillus sp.]
MKPLRDELAELIRTEFSRSALWGWKDPRTCLLIPIWKELSEELGFKLSFVHIIRNPLEVAESLQKRNGFTPRKGWALWSLYVIYALRDSIDYPMLLIDYADLLKDWRSVVSRLSHTLQLSLPLDRTVFDDEVDSFLKPGLRHSVRTVSEALVALPAPIAELYHSVVTWCQGDAPLNSDALWDLERVYRIAAEIGFCSHQPSVFPRIQVYYSGTGEFREEESRSQIVRQTIDPVTYKFPVSGHLNHIRLDPIDVPAVISIQAAHIECSDQRFELLRGPDDVNPFLSSGMEIISGPECSSLRLLIYSNDPQIGIRLPNPISGDAVLYVTMAVEQLISRETAEAVQTAILRTRAVMVEEMERVRATLEARAQALQVALAEEVEKGTALSAKIGKIQKELENISSVNQALLLQIETLQRMKEEAENHVFNFKSRVEELQAELARETAKGIHLSAQVNQLRNDVEHLSRANDELQRAFNAVLSSRSWRWTAPLRALSRAVRQMMCLASSRSIRGDSDE